MEKKCSGVSKPKIELKDFYEFLDPKVVEKIKQTPKNSVKRIADDVKEFQSHLE